MADANRSPGRAPRGATAGTVRQRRTGGTATTASRSRGTGNSGGLWKFYTEDSTGLKITSFGYEPRLHRFRFCAAYLGKIHTWSLNDDVALFFDLRRFIIYSDALPFLG
uniref:Uncharacterized protein n=1 Tax=Panagrolaimus sp. JU765 TaxID=591449 RepID=A0AC34RJ02_9BILA